MSRSVFPALRLLSKWTPRHRALSLALALAFLLPAFAPRPTAAGWLDDLWACLRFFGAEEGALIIPGGRPAAEPPSGAAAIWAEEGWGIDPSGLVTPPPPSTAAPDRF